VLLPDVWLAFCSVKYERVASARLTKAPAGSATAGQGQADFPQEGQVTPEPGQTLAGWAFGMHVGDFRLLEV